MEIKWERWSDSKPTENGWYMTFNENTKKFDMLEWESKGWSGKHSEISHWIKVELPEKPPKYSIASFPKSKNDDHLYWVEEYYDKVKSDNVIDEQVAFGAFVYEDRLEGCIDLRIYLNHQEYIFKAIDDKLFGEYGNEFSYQGTLDFNGKTFWFYVSSYHRGDYLALFDSPKDSYKDVFEWFLKHKPEDKHPDSIVNISLDREINDPIYIDNKLFEYKT